VQQALSEGPKKLSEVFAECCTRPCALEEQGLGKSIFAECQTIGTKRLFFRVSMRHSTNNFSMVSPSPVAGTSSGHASAGASGGRCP
jgi:hypothetical protein